MSIDSPLRTLGRVEFLDPSAVLDYLLGDAYDTTENALVVFYEIGVLRSHRFGQSQVGVLKRLLHLESTIGAFANVVRFMNK